MVFCGEVSEEQNTASELGVAEAKRRFSELTDRVERGETFVVARRGRPAVALVPPELVSGRRSAMAPTGLAAAAGALADWDDLETDIEEIVAARSRASERTVPDLD